MCKRVSGKAKLTPEQKAAYAKRKGKKLSATTKARIAKALKLERKNRNSMIVDVKGVVRTSQVKYSRILAVC